MTTLLLRLTGPMQSWGTISRFRIRDTNLEPSKSGVVGLLCAALGKPREERPGDESRWPALEQLAGLTMGVRVDRPGQVNRDYHTAGGVHRKGDRYGVVNANANDRSTVVSERYYLADAQFLVGLESEDRGLLERLHAALQAPVWPLFLGRKAFVPGAPVWLPDGLQDRPLREALLNYPWLARSESEAVRMRRLAAEGRLDPIRLVFDAPYGSTSEVRHDVPLDFATRRFTVRYVTVETVPLSADLIKEESACISPA